MGSSQTSFPRQMLPYSAKTRKWAQSVVDWAENRTYFKDEGVSATVREMCVNYDLLNGEIHMDDLRDMLDPFGTRESYIPDRIRHYPLLNSKVNVLVGEESRRKFDFSVCLTNPESINLSLEEKSAEVSAALQRMISEGIEDERELDERMERLDDYFRYTYRDRREVMANELVKHLNDVYDVPTLQNKGFKDVLAAGCEIYQWVIEGGEPRPYRLNPKSVRVLRSGYSDRIEDADAVIIEEYWSPGRIYDTYYDVLTQKDREYIERIGMTTYGGTYDGAGFRDERRAFIDRNMVSEVPRWNDEYWEGDRSLFRDTGSSLLPYDTDGNIRVIRVYWKSKRKIKRVKSYDPETGEELFELYPETYRCDRAAGEEERVMWVNEAWEGVKIGEEVYVNMRPCPVQYGTASNPSRCHFGIVGSYYNINGERPYPLVSIMKNYNYLYDILHHEMLGMIKKNLGRVIPYDLSKKPAKWEVEKVLHFAKVNGILVQNSFNEGQYGAATGKLAGALNNNAQAWDADFLANATSYIRVMEWLKEEMGDVAGINRQREGQVYNRETVGGIERANLQSSYITEHLFVIHDNVKKRFWEVGLETAKIAYRGNRKFFENTLSDGSKVVLELDGDEFRESDYGLVVDNSEYGILFRQKLDALAQAALQNQLLNFSTIVKLYGSSSMLEKQRLIENAERRRSEEAQRAAQQEQELKRQELEAAAQEEASRQEHEERIAAENNEARILSAQIQAQGRVEAEREYGAAMERTRGDDGAMGEADRARLDEQVREFDVAMGLEARKFESGRRLREREVRLKERMAGLTNRSKGR